MAKMSFDPEDIGLLVAGILASGVMVGLVTVQAFGYSLADSLFAFGGSDVSVAYLLSAATFAGVLVTNDNTDLISVDGLDKLRDSGMADHYVYLILGALVALVAWLFVPEIAEFFTSEDIWGVLYVAGMGVAQVALGWMY